MTVLNLNNIDGLYYEDTEVEKLYFGSQQLYPLLPVDPYLANVVLHLKGDGENNSTNIIDSSPSPKTITRFGDTKISTTQSKYGGSSIYFDGSGDYLRLNSYTDTLADFTVEGWAYVAVSNWNGVFVANGSNNYSDGALNNTGRFRSQVGGTNQETANNVPVNQWFHYAVSRSNGSVKVFVNGTQNHTLTNNTNVSFANNIYIGSYNGSQFYLNGYLDSLRITKGVARYTANFNPETDTYLAY